MDRLGSGSGGAKAFLEERVAEAVEHGDRARHGSALEALFEGVGGMFEIPLDRLRRDPAQPRKDFDEGELAELAENMKQLGQLQPVVVRPIAAEAGYYMIVMGERRWRAAALAGLPALQCILRQEDARLIPAKQWAENHFRADLSPIEEAGAIKSVMELEDLDTPGFAARYHLSERTVRRYLQLLAAPVWIQAAVVKGEQVKVGEGVEVRKLDLTGAVELQRIYNTYLRKEEAEARAKNQGDKMVAARAVSVAAKKAQQRAEALKRRAFRENWSRRRWQNFAADAAETPKAALVEKRQKPLFECSGSRLVIHLDRWAAASAGEIDSLRGHLGGMFAGDASVGTGESDGGRETTSPVTPD